MIGTQTLLLSVNYILLDADFPSNIEVQASIINVGNILAPSFHHPQDT